MDKATTKGDMVTTIRFGKSGSKTFKSLEEIVAWRQLEDQFWKRLSDSYKGRPTILADIHNNVRGKFFHRIDEIINRLKGTDLDDQAQIKSLMDTIANHIDSYLQHNQFLFSWSPEGKFIDELLKENPEGAVYAAGALLGLEMDSTIPAAIEGYFLAIAYKHGFKSTVKSERGALETLRKEWQDLLVESRTIFDTASSQYKALEKKYMDQIEGQKNEFDKFKQSSESDFKTLVDGSTKELKNIERTYDQRLALRAAVQYWKRKATSHQRNARRLSWAASIVGIIVAIALAVEAAAIIDSSNTIGNLAIWKIAVFLLTCIPGIWAIRILVRLLLSNLHLNSDAVERRTMLLTYLALLRRGEGPSEDKKDLILNMLFRPCATGIVKDDALPSIAAKWLKIITG